MADIDASIAETQKVLGAIIQKPKLTEGLLKKPPFRFLHDIVTEVKKVSGFPASTILTDFDLDSGNFKDKDSKVAYLNKIIGAVSEAAGTPLQVKPLKIVAGLEPELTNELLQALAKASQGAAF
ncbi:microtubule-binding protein MIP-T3-domain-containing protein [Baffinella frigidus]|nr:microtubule-binding protein MIP-T3-domain-containing protein [Cryptophyta sp. CCMP2293]